MDHHLAWGVALLVLLLRLALHLDHLQGVVLLVPSVQELQVLQLEVALA